jgi:hypothetical protein
MHRQHIVRHEVLHAGTRVNHAYRARRPPLRRYLDAQPRALAVSSGHHRATPGPRCNAQVARMTLR